LTKIEINRNISYIKKERTLSNKHVNNRVTTVKKSMGTEVDPITCLNVTGGNQFELVLLAAMQARKITKETGNRTGSPVLALLDIQEGKVEPLINQVKKTS
jgi:DNA-directed RNA polymerase subunit K/omega